MISIAFSFIELLSYSTIETNLIKKLFLLKNLWYLSSSIVFNINNLISSSCSFNNKFIKYSKI